MSPAIRRMLWVAFIGLALLTIAGVAGSISVLQMDQQIEARIIDRWRPLIDNVRQMDESISTMVSSGRGYVITGETAFQQQYDDAVRTFDTASLRVRELGRGTADEVAIEKLIRHQRDVKEYTDAQMATRNERTVNTVANLRRIAPDYSQQIVDRVRGEQREMFDHYENRRGWLTMVIILAGIVILGVAAVVLSRIHHLLSESLVRQVRRTEAMIAGM